MNLVQSVDRQIGLDGLYDTLTEASRSHLCDDLSVYLPFLFNLKGRPLSLADYPMMMAFYPRNVPPKEVWKCARQVTKTSNISTCGLLYSLLSPHIRLLYAAPLMSQISNLSNNYIRPLVHHSPIHGILVDGSDVMDNTFNKRFANGSIMYFSYAYRDVDRIRGISADCLFIDEVQDMNTEFIPIIDECLSHSSEKDSPLWGIRRYTGTPKTLDNTIEGLWEQSSQAEWVIRCSRGACSKHNVCCLSEDLSGMIGEKGLICAKCHRAVNPRDGYWIHGVEDRARTFPGRHVPQAIVPLWCENQEKWSELLQKINTYGMTAKTVNEVFGESCDRGAKLITKQDLVSAATLGENTIETALALSGRYATTVLGVDWGGKGMDDTSTTTMTIVGIKPSGGADVLYGARFNAMVTDTEETKEILRLFNKFNCSLLAHDYAGAGPQREIIMLHMGMQSDKIFPISYVRFGKGHTIEHRKSGTRNYYSLDKARALRLVCAMIKMKHLLLPKWDSCKDLAQDFLSLHEEPVSNNNELTYVTKTMGTIDDWADSTTYAAIGGWWLTGSLDKLINRGSGQD